MGSEVYQEGLEALREQVRCLEVESKVLYRQLMLIREDPWHAKELADRAFDCWRCKACGAKRVFDQLFNQLPCACLGAPDG